MSAIHELIVLSTGADYVEFGGDEACEEGLAIPHDAYEALRDGDTFLINAPEHTYALNLTEVDVARDEHLRPISFTPKEKRHV